MVSLVLGGVTFQNFEIPERINFGGRQHAAVHKLIGGNRVVDAMGPDADDVNWSGRFRGPDAMERAQALDAMRSAGAQVTLSYMSTFLVVLITEFKAEPERFYEIPYKITCTVVTDLINDALGAIVNGIDTIVGNALTVAASFTAGGTSAAQIATAAAVSTVSTAVSAAGSLQDASTATLSTVTSTVYTAASTIDGIAAGLDATLGVGAGTLPGVDPDQMASFITSQLQNTTDESAALFSKDNINLIGKNLALQQG
ncbi:hypothetical protein A6U86_05430 [Rhizobium sp. AC27/96]|uniref:hypothetical protein n=1 Tax=Rhizobium sp. AC27/96 TaxID=1841653 RepID=UPI0008278F14|nr:hypothetical protein [Rhizobium sp. AC27/96]OCJ12465.1 hypothetical protein A6U86_05430 [Rhizobium sp. AC27/96]